MKRSIFYLLIILTSLIGCKKDPGNSTTTPTPQGRYIGEEWGGGIVAYIDYSNGEAHGLILAIDDLDYGSKAGEVWSNVDSLLIGINDLSKDTNGWINTLKIIQQDGHLRSAAQACREYQGGGYNDWYLPSFEEMRKIHENNTKEDRNFILRSTGGPGAWWVSNEISATETTYVRLQFDPSYWQRIGYPQPKSSRKGDVHPIRKF